MFGSILAELLKGRAEGLAASPNPILVNIVEESERKIIYAIRIYVIENNALSHGAITTDKPN